MMKNKIKTMSLLLIMMIGIWIGSTPNFKSQSVYQAKYPYYNFLRVKIAKLTIASKYKTYWYNDICDKQNNLNEMKQSQRLDYYIAILIKLSDKLVKSGEGGLIYYECILEEDKLPLSLRLDDFVTTKLYSNINDDAKDFIKFVRHALDAETFGKNN